MKLLIIDNQTNLLEQIKALCREHAYEIVSAADVPKVSVRDYDAVILTGGCNHPAISDHFIAERELIRKANLPIIGICLGFQLIVVAHGGILIRGTERRLQQKAIRPTAAGTALFGGPADLTVGSAHRWYAKEVPEELIVLATSATGIEAVAHRTKPIIGFQFHPESALSGATGQRVFDRALAQYKI